MARTSTTLRSSNSLDLEAVKKDLRELMRKSQDWWPADSATTDLCSSVWRGTAPAPTAPATAAAAQATQPALCTPQQLARQCEPRQGAPTALPIKPEVRPENFLGRPDDPRRQRRPGIDGFKTFGFGGGRETSGNRKRTSTGVPRASGLETSATPVTGNSRSPSAPFRWPDLCEPGRPNGNPDPIAAARDIARSSLAWR